MVQKKKSNFRGKVADDAKRQQKAATSYGYLSLPKGLSVFTPEPGGRVSFDIIPYTVTDTRHPDKNEEAGVAVEGSPWYKRPFKLHRNVGAGNDTAVCPTSIGKKCPICEYRAKRLKEGADKEETDALKASLRALYLVRPKGHKKFEDELHLFDISLYNFQNLLNDELEEIEAYEVFPDLEEGYTLKVRFDSKTVGGGNPFAQASRIDFVEREEQYSNDDIENSPSLDDILIIPSYDELKAKFFEIDDEEDGGKLKKPSKKKEEDDDEEEEEEKPRRKKPVKDDDDDDEEEEKPRRSKPSKKDDDEDEEEEEEEEEEKPRSKKTVSKKKDDDDDDDEEEEEEKPAKSSSGKKCPAKHQFGVDTNKFDDCEDCTLWDACLEAKRKRR